jgi:hypothetical protein
MADAIEIKLDDERDEGLAKFANLVDPIKFSLFIEKLKLAKNDQEITDTVSDFLDR